MNKKLFALLLITICCLFGINNVKASEGKDQIGSKTQYCLYCNGNDCRHILLAMNREIYGDKGKVRIFENDNLKEFITKTGIVDFNDVNRVAYDYEYKGCPDFLHYFVIHTNALGPDAILAGIEGNERVYDITFKDNIDDYIEERRADHDSLTGLFQEGEVTVKKRYTLKYSYGFDSYDVSDTSWTSRLKTLAKDAKEESGIGKFNINDGSAGCAVLSGAIKDKVNWFLNLIKYAGTALAIILGAADFLKAVLSDEDNASKKAFGKAIKRIIAAILLFLLPLLIQLLFTAIDNPVIQIPGFNVDSPTCGIGVSE